MSGLFEFYFVNDQLMNMGSVNSAAELQGVLCGRLCTGEQLSPSDWQAVALEFLDLDYITPNEEQEALFKLILERTAELLSDDSYGFNPLLPGDTASLERRSQELGSWCEGFLHGLGQAIGKAGLGQGDDLPKDVGDALRDMAHISQVVVDGDAALEAEENEVYWVELVEYVKIAVLTVHAELTAKTPATVMPSDNSPDNMH
ncbi:UPF0149 family protein [Teredinibacter purpureus]|uniref:UPF0149 family protein n=1 Tax=Teredinibacter purpureus TaxID=2731756 RepID=UPI0005F8874B|nr:UPF0149 family protein [Teredinibacter purpureus]